MRYTKVLCACADAVNMLKCLKQALSSLVPVLFFLLLQCQSSGRLHAIDQDTVIKMTVINPCHDICLQEYGVQPETQLEMHHSTQVLLCHNHHHPDYNSPTSHHKPATHMDISKNLPHQSPYPLVQTGTRRTALPETPFSLSYKLNSAFSRQVYLILPSSLPHGASYLRLPCKSPSNCFTSHTPVA